MLVCFSEPLGLNLLRTLTLHAIPRVCCDRIHLVLPKWSLISDLYGSMRSHESIAGVLIT